MNKQNKIISLLMSALIVFSLFSPAALKAEESDTDPTDENLINETVGNEKKEDDDIVPSEGSDEEKPAEELSADNEEPVFSLGYLPDNFLDKEGLFVHRQPQLKARKAGSESTFPSSYVTHLSPIRNQGHYGTCWSFASMASAESTYYQKTGTELDLSELHLAFFGYHNKNAHDKLDLINEDSFAFGTEDSQGNLLQSGGNYFITAFLLAAGIGFTGEDKLPYSILDQQDYSIDRFTDVLINTYGENYNDKCYKESDYYLADEKIMIGSDIESIKEVLYNGGAVGISYYAIPSLYSNQYYNSNTCAYYCYDKRDANHAVTIVGWDDGFSRENFVDGRKDPDPEKPLPQNDGAWLIRNSWGEVYGDKGYFWLSYEDASIQNQNCVQFHIEPVNDLRIYQYDGTVPIYELSDLSNKKKAEYGNIFVAQEDEVIERAGFFNPYSDMETTIKVYRNVKDKPDDGDLLTSQTVQHTYAGYHTYEFPEKICIGKGESFSIVISQRSLYDEDVILYATTDYDDGFFKTTDRRTPGQSFLIENNEWVDLYDEEIGFTAVVKAYASPTAGADKIYELQETTVPVYDPEDPGRLRFTFKRKVLDDLTYERFAGIAVDGKGVDEEDYVIDRGSLIISLKARYLKNLDPGEHLLSVYFKDGQSSSAKFLVLKEKPKYVPPMTGIQ